MAGFKRPGVYASEITSPGNVANASPGSAVPTFVGPINKGPITPSRIRTWQQFVTIYGGFIGTTVQLLPYAVYSFFNNGGSECLIQRVIGTASVAATADLVDRAATPQTTLTVTALNAGAWANDVTITVLDRGTDRFDLVVYSGGSTDDKVVERWLDLSMDDTDSRYVVNVINSASNGSVWIEVEDGDSATTPPSNRPAIDSTDLANGANGGIPSNSAYDDAFAEFDSYDDALVINIPGNSTNAVLSSAIAYCENRGDSFLIIDTTSDLTPAQAITEAGALTQSSYAAVFYPWINSSDPASSLAGATRLLPPGGAVMGVMVGTDTNTGPHKAFAGIAAKIQGATSLERRLTPSDLDDLNDSHVNAVRHHSVAGIVIFGARTLMRTSTLRYIPVRRNMIYIKDTSRRLTEFAIFESNDATTWAVIRSRITQFLTNHWQTGGLRGSSEAEAFYVICDETNNTDATIAAGEVHVEVGVAVEIPAEFIVFKIGQWSGGQQSVFEV